MSGPATLHLLRHGAPARAGRLLGHADDPVTPAGIAACARRAADLRIGRIVSSDLARAAGCADAIAAARGLSPTRDPRWRELDFGRWDGQAPAAVDPGALARFRADPDGCPPPGGERWSALVARVSAALDAIGDGHGEEGGQALVVTHAGAMRAALAALCGFSAQQVWAFALPYAALLTLSVWPGPRPCAEVAGLRA